MTDEQNVEQAQEPEMVFEGTAPGEDLDSYLEVSAKATINAEAGEYKAATGYFRFGKDLDEAVALYGADVVFSNFRAQAKIKLQSLMRSWVKEGKDINELLTTWKPGVQMERTPVDPLVAAEKKFDSLSAEEQAAFIEKLMAKNQ